MASETTALKAGQFSGDSVRTAPDGTSPAMDAPNATAAAAADHSADRAGAASAHSSEQASTSSAPKDPVRLRHGQGEKGCSHYRRRVKMVSPCCNEVFWCRHCHNQVHMEDEPDPKLRHELDRRAVTQVICAMCDTQQPVADHCAACGAAFGAYSCLQCCFFDDELERKQFHCIACGICRVGGKENFFHCDTCGCCYARSLQDNHVCVENSMRQNCPVCFEFLFDSVRPTAVLQCGHTIHSECLKELGKNHQTTCPICMKSYGPMEQMWAQLDMEVAATEMPTEYRNWKVELCCNDCGLNGRCKFHIVGQKCPGCGSYNTRRIKVERIPPGADSGPVAEPPPAAP